MQITVCDWDECPNEAIFSVGIGESTDSTLHTWAGLSFDACLKHYDAPIGVWVEMWNKGLREQEAG